MHAVLPAKRSDSDEAVERFLRANPGWLAARPDLYRALVPPVRVHGDAMADHMVAMVARERRYAAAMAERHEALLVAGRTTATALARIQEAIGAFIAADDRTECITVEIPRIMMMDAAVLCHWEGSSVADRHIALLDQIMDGEDVAFRDAPADAAFLYVEAAALAAYDLLIRVPGVGVLGLASRHPVQTELRFARQHLKFLGSVMGAILRPKSYSADPSDPE